MAEGFGDAVRRLRTARGWSQRELARRAPLDSGHLSRIERSQRPPTPQLAGCLDRALDADGQLIALAHSPDEVLSDGRWQHVDAEDLTARLLAERPTAGNAIRLAHEWLIAEPPQLTELRAGRRIDAGTVDRAERRAHQLRQLDDHVGGRETYQMVSGELAATAQLVREASYSDCVGQRLLGVVSELCQLAGWVASDAGRRRDAERLYLTGVHAGHAAGDRALAANNLSSLAYQVANTGAAADAVTLARTAVCGAASATPKVRALLQDRLAWAYAKSGDVRLAERAVGQAAAALGQTVGEEPIWVYWVSAEELDVMEGRVWTQLRRPLRAVPILERATVGYGPDNAREAALYLSWLGEAFLQAGEVEQAAATATRVLRLSRAAGSARADDRTAGLRQLLDRHRGLDAVDDFVGEHDEGRSGCGRTP
jgi:transcriptional regulator with XRE-family HTH domain